MKTKLVLFSMLVCSLLASCAVQKVESQKMPANPKSEITNPKSVVLVELFTSEGCSSCPPADRALAFLQKEQPVPQAEIIALALHVDYWNRLGWKDEFSSPRYSQRQEFYASKFKLDSVYTPQMIVDGQWQFIGSDLGKAAKAVMEAAKSPKAAIQIGKTADKLTLAVSDLPKHETATVFVALAENNLTTKVARGENRGQTLEHSAVVRDLRAVGTITPSETGFTVEADLLIEPEWKSENLIVVVFIQENASRKILGSSELRFASKWKLE